MNRNNIIFKVGATCIFICSTILFNSTNAKENTQAINFFIPLAAHLTYPDTKGNLDLDSTLGLGISYRYNLFSTFSIGLYAQYTQSDVTINATNQPYIKDYTFKSSWYTFGPIIDVLWTESILWNIGIGIGNATLACDNKACNNFFIERSSDTVVTYEIWSDIKWRFVTDWSVDLGYRHMMSDTTNLQSNQGVQNFFNTLDANIYTLGMGYYF